jgi:hypothetical protein
LLPLFLAAGIPSSSAIADPIRRWRMNRSSSSNHPIRGEYLPTAPGSRGWIAGGWWPHSISAGRE